MNRRLAPSRNAAPPESGADPLWYKDAIIYQVHVRAFFDSNADGIGDLAGLTRKLDYLQELGVTAVWLLPFYPSPLRDDGYDTADYTAVHPDYGTLRDFQRFLREAHKRGIRVITELVVNHTSDQHPWFQRARRAKPNSKWRDFYVWSDTSDRYPEARIIFKDFETSNWEWDPVAGAYYWHRFYSHQPDLNYESPHVQQAVLKVLDFWMSMGVDGMRLDAVPYLYEREGTNCENLPETHAFLRRLRRHVDERYGDRMLLAEANQWPEDACTYFGRGDECHMCFHFPVMPRLFMAVRMEDRFPILDILQQTPPIPANSQWAVFLRNHDELTLEMVTDEERDYMYRVYAHDPRARINLGIRRRLAPLLGNDRRRIELMNGLLFSLPGTPILYYGDEIGMGDNIYLGDRNGVRTPMQWSPDRNAGFSRTTPQKLYFPVIIDPEYHFETVNVEAQSNNPHSLLWWTRRLIALRKQFRAFGRGSLRFLNPENNKILVFLREYEEEKILVVANLSRFVQCVELDLSAFETMVPVELFGRTRFPPIGKLPYFLTLGPHAFYWFSLQAQETEAREPESHPVLYSGPDWRGVLSARGPGSLQALLVRLLPQRRWFGAKARKIQNVRILDTVPAANGVAKGESKKAFEFALVTVEFTEGEAETYVLPLAFASREAAGKALTSFPHAVLARIEGSGGEEHGVLYEAHFDPEFAALLLQAIEKRKRFRGAAGEIFATTTTAFRKAKGPEGEDITPSLLRAEQSNTSIAFGQRFIFKLFRRVEGGLNPDLELGRFLTEKAAFAHTPETAGAMEYRRDRSDPISIGILQEFVKNQGDAWSHTLDVFSRYLERVLGQQKNPPPPLEGATASALLDLADAEASEEDRVLIGPFLEQVQLLGKRTGELHLALASRPEPVDFRPEDFTTLYQRSVYQSMRNHLGRIFELLERRRDTLPAPLQEPARSVLGLEEIALASYRALLGRRISARRIRIHGDYHLGQVLFTGNDYVIIDFEGEPARPIGERRLKRSPLRDVAGMLRSLHYAMHAGIRRVRDQGQVPAGHETEVRAWGRHWQIQASARFLKAYFETAGSSGLFPAKREPLAMLLDVFLLDKAVYELGYELNSRPDWVEIPLEGILELLEPERETAPKE